MPASSRLGIALVALVVAAYLASVVGNIRRPLHVDEAEYLHTTWLMDQGKTIYRDFMQDHSPFLFQFMSLFNPNEPGGIYPLLDLGRFTSIGRILAGLCGALVLVAAAWLAVLAARNALAALIAFSYILQDPLIWERGLADLRSDPFSLAMLWGGALLVVITHNREPRRWDALLSGSGIALVAGAALLNPKWPLESIVIGVVYLMTLWRLLRARGWGQVLLSLLPTAIVLAIGALMIVSVTTFTEYVYYTFQLKTGIQHHVRSADVYELEASGNAGWWRVIDLSDVVVLAACALLVLAARRWPAVRELLDARRTVILLALALASIAELPFYEPYTLMWAQYRVSYTIAVGILQGVVVAMLYAAAMAVIARQKPESRNNAVVLFTVVIGLMLQFVLVLSMLQRASMVVRAIILLCVLAGWVPAVLAFLHASGRRKVVDAERRLPLWSATVAAAMLSVVHLTPLILGGNEPRIDWSNRARLQRNLRPGDQVWLSPGFHPIAAPDASYFWYAFTDVTAGALSQAMRPDSLLPRMREQDLPPCRIAAGLDQQTRFIELGRWMSQYPNVSRCTLELLRRGMLVPTTYEIVFEVRRPGRQLVDWKVPPKKARFRLRRLEAAAQRASGTKPPLPSSP